MARFDPARLPPVAPGESPVNPVPLAALLLFLLIAGVEVVLSLAGAGALGGREGIGWRVGAIEDWAVSPDLVAWGLEGHPGVLGRLFTFPFVHAGPMHALVGGAIVLALGKVVGEAVGNLAVLVVFLLAGAAGGLLFGLLLDGPVPLYGCYPGAYGLIGAYTLLLWLRLGQRGANRLMAFRLIAALLAVQFVFAVLFGGSPAWIADLGGFLAGLALAVPFMPAARRALGERLRAR